MLRDLYGIETRIVAGCVVNKKIIGHSKGYNEVSHLGIERRFGKDIWDKILREERAFNEANMPALRSLTDLSLGNLNR